MRLIALFIVAAFYAPALADDVNIAELEKVKLAAENARKAAEADPTIKDAKSAPVVAYLAEQQRRRLTSLHGLRQRIEQYQGDKSKEALIPSLKEQLAELQRKPAEEVSFQG